MGYKADAEKEEEIKDKSLDIYPQYLFILKI